MTLIRSLPMMLESFRVGAAQFGSIGRQGGQVSATPERTARDLPMPLLLAGLAVVVLVMAVIPQVFGGLDDLGTGRWLQSASRSSPSSSSPWPRASSAWSA